MTSASDPLGADCSQCAGLCCVVPQFSRSSEFDHDKPAGKACRHLGADFRCGVHERLRGLGFSGCVTFTCFGAGQRLTASLGSNAKPPDEAVFFGLRQLHQTLWLLREALAYVDSGALREALRHAFSETEALVEAMEIRPYEPGVELLRRVSEEIRARLPGPHADLAGAQLLGADLRNEDLRGANLRGAVLVGARLDGVTLAGADLTATDLRGARLHGADLSQALFVHPSQLEAAIGDVATLLPPKRDRPVHWT